MQLLNGRDSLMKNNLLNFASICKSVNISYFIFFNRDTFLRKFSLFFFSNIALYRLHKIFLFHFILPYFSFSNSMDPLLAWLAPLATKNEFPKTMSRLGSMESLLVWLMLVGGKSTDPGAECENVVMLRIHIYFFR